DLGPLEHEEIAVSILAGLVAEKSAGSLTSSASSGTVEAPQTAVDPVCGMSVEIATARFTHEHGGEMLYFCCPGCRTAFIAEPEAYASK
ncbi:MAG: YHS domain-containing protein, partial [Acidimicrobiia bacterium]